MKKTISYINHTESELSSPAEVKPFLSMSITGVEKEDQETGVSITALSDDMVVYTSDNTTWTKLKRLIKSNPTEWKLIRASSTVGKPDKLVYVEVRGPKKYLSFRTKETGNKLSAEARAEAAERLKKIRAQKTSETVENS